MYATVILGQPDTWIEIGPVSDPKDQTRPFLVPVEKRAFSIPTFLDRALRSTHPVERKEKLDFFYSTGLCGWEFLDLKKKRLEPSPPLLTTHGRATNAAAARNIFLACWVDRSTGGGGAVAAAHSAAPPIAGDHIEYQVGPTVDTKTSLCVPIFINNTWSYVLWSPP